MIIDVTGPILDYKGHPLRQPVMDGEGRPTFDDEGRQVTEMVTFRDTFIQALNMTKPNQPEPSATEKIRSFRLSLLIADKDKVELTAEDVLLLKKATGENLTQIGAGRCADLLAEPDESRGVDDPDDGDVDAPPPGA